MLFFLENLWFINKIQRFDYIFIKKAYKGREWFIFHFFVSTEIKTLR